MQVKEAIHRYEYCVGAPFPFSPIDFSVGEEAKRDHGPTLQICIFLSLSLFLVFWVILVDSLYMIPNTYNL